MEPPHINYNKPINGWPYQPRWPPRAWRWCWPVWSAVEAGTETKRKTRVFNGIYWWFTGILMGFWWDFDGILNGVLHALKKWSSWDSNGRWIDLPVIKLGNMNSLCGMLLSTLSWFLGGPTYEELQLVSQCCSNFYLILSLIGMVWRWVDQLSATGTDFPTVVGHILHVSRWHPSFCLFTVPRLIVYQLLVLF